jgi:hypothetical protein
MNSKESDEPTTEKEVAAQKKRNDDLMGYSRDQYLDGEWESFCITGNPSYLSNFVRYGGDISDQKTRDIVANELAAAPYKNPGGAKPEENIWTYMDVQWLMTFSRMKKTAAIAQVAKDKNIEPQSCRGRYDSGAALLGYETSTRK